MPACTLSHSHACLRVFCVWVFCLHIGVGTGGGALGARAPPSFYVVNAHNSRVVSNAYCSRVVNNKCEIAAETYTVYIFITHWQCLKRQIHHSVRHQKKSKKQATLLGMLDRASSHRQSHDPSTDHHQDHSCCSSSSETPSGAKPAATEARVEIETEPEVVYSSECCACTGTTPTPFQPKDAATIRHTRCQQGQKTICLAQVGTLPTRG